MPKVKAAPKITKPTTPARRRALAEQREIRELMERIDRRLEEAEVKTRELLRDLGLPRGA